MLLPDGTSSKENTGEFTTEQLGTYTFIVYDNVGNEKKVSIEIQNIDKIEPELKLSQNTEEWVNEDVIISWETSDAGSGFNNILLPDGTTSKNQNGTISAKTNGNYSFVSCDNVGNTNLQTIEITNIDKIAPTVTLELVEENEIKIVKWTLADNESGIREMLLPDGTTSTESSGNFEIEASGTYTFVGYDKAGNITIKSMKIDV